MEWLFILLFFILGLAIGSFLDVIISRIFLTEKKESFLDIAVSRSRCNECGSTLKWYDLIPLISFLSLGGRCRYCHKLIPVRLFGMEFITGLMFAFLAYWTLVQSIPVFPTSFFYLGYLLIIYSILTIIFIVDLKQYLIPNTLVYFLIFFAGTVETFWAWVSFRHIPWDLHQLLVDGYWMIRVFLPANLVNSWTYTIPFFSALPAFLSPLLGALLGGGFFGLIILFTRGKGMGMGDVKLAIFMGFFLGIENIMVALYLAFVLGAGVSLILLILGKKKLRGMIPFGPFLIIGTWLSLFYGEQLLMLIFPK